MHLYTTVVAPVPCFQSVSVLVVVYHDASVHNSGCSCPLSSECVGASRGVSLYIYTHATVVAPVPCLQSVSVLVVVYHDASVHNSGCSCPLSSECVGASRGVSLYIYTHATVVAPVPCLQSVSVLVVVYHDASVHNSGCSSPLSSEYVGASRGVS